MRWSASTTAQAVPDPLAGLRGQGQTLELPLLKRELPQKDIRDLSRDFVHIASRFLDAPGPGCRAESSLIANLIVAAAAFTHGLEQQHQVPAMTRVGSRTRGHLA